MSDTPWTADPELLAKVGALERQLAAKDAEIERLEFALKSWKAENDMTTELHEAEKARAEKAEREYLTTQGLYKEAHAMWQKAERERDEEAREHGKTQARERHCEAERDEAIEQRDAAEARVAKLTEALRTFYSETYINEIAAAEGREEK